MAAAACGAAALLLAAALAWAEPDGSSDRDATGPEPAATANSANMAQSPRSQAVHRMREGTEVVDQLGYFRVTGDRVTFFTEDGKGRLVALENLNLDRVARAVADNPDSLQWIVTGTITEYRGANFLFVRRAVLKTQLESAAEGS